MTFPENFFIGAATAAHQVEGNNTNSDDWALEHIEHSDFVEPSGIACDHYNRFEEDIRLMAEAGLTAYRFSIEWARVEPEEGVFDADAIDHYRRVVRCCKEHGLEPVVTMMHFTSPVWLIRNGGWEDERTVGAFANYCRKIAEEFGDELEYVCTINEANMGLQVAKIMERYKRQMMAAAARAQDAGASQEGTVQVGMNLSGMMERMKAAAMEKAQIFGTPDPKVFVGGLSADGDRLIMRAHEAARDAMKAVCPHLKIGLTLSVHDIQVPEGYANDEAANALAAQEWNEEFRHYLPTIKNDDFLGVQNYTRSEIGPDGILPVPEGAETTQMDYEFYPEALEHVIRRMHEDFNGELIVTENGIATADDSRRLAFIEQALSGVSSCIEDGIPVGGYFYWSLMDNFEWQKGYSMTFGLIAVDRETLERKPKASLAYLGGFAKQ